MSDAQLIEESQLDSSAFAGIFDRHAPVLLGYLVRRVGRDEAENLVGELFRVAFESRSRYDLSRPDARPWLYGIAANLVMKHHRSTKLHHGAMQHLALVRQELPDGSFDERFVNDVANAQVLAEINTLMDGLPERDREVAFLYAWQELSYNDIAAALDIPVGTVRSRLNRVRSMLRELRASSGEEPDNPTPRAQGEALR